MPAARPAEPGIRGAFSGLLLGLALLWLLSACSPPEPLRIGFIGGLSGRVADLGVAGKDGVQLAVEDINAAGGIHGRPLELLVRDDAQNPALARRAAEQLMAAGVELIVGPMTSAMAEALLPLTNPAGMLLISPTVTSTHFSGRDDHFFRVISSTRDYASEAARVVVQERGLSRAAIIVDDDNRAYTADWAEHFRQAFDAAGGRIVHREQFRSSVDESLLGAVVRMMESGPDLIVVVTGAVDAARIVQLLRQRSAAIDVLLADWAGTERLLELGGGAVEGAYIPQYFDRDDRSSRYLDFRERYIARFGIAPGFASVAGYDATLVAAEVLRQRRSGQALKDLLAGQGFDGLQQRIEFDAHGDARRPIRVAVVREGRFLVLPAQQAP
jgi:branched-chain amino acid transport system substrate-binding protein